MDAESPTAAGKGAGACVRALRCLAIAGVVLIFSLLLARPVDLHSSAMAAVPGSSEASSRLPGLVARRAISVTLLEPGGAVRWPAESDFLARSKFIECPDTSGGVTPAASYADSANVEATALNPYSTGYLFYKPME